MIRNSIVGYTPVYGVPAAYICILVELTVGMGVEVGVTVLVGVFVAADIGVTVEVGEFVGVSDGVELGESTIEK